MNESILINHYQEEQGKLSRFFDILRNSSEINLATVQTRGNVIKIMLKKESSINPTIIKDCFLTCVVENELFRTIYIEGKRIMWDSIHNEGYSSPSHSL